MVDFRRIEGLGETIISIHERIDGLGGIVERND